MKPYVIAGFVLALFLVIAAVIRQLPHEPLVKGASEGNVSVKPTLSVQSINGTDTVEVINERKDGLLYRYTSRDLGISFTFVSNQSIPGNAWHALRTDNTICLTYDQSDTMCEKGQFVEILKKMPEQSLAEAIQSTFLYGITPDQCFVKDYSQQNDTSPYEYAEIAYPEDPDAETPFFENEYAQYCPERYRKSNGIRYFMFNPSFPDRYAFFNIGQYAISGGASDKAWQQTVVFTEISE